MKPFDLDKAKQGHPVVFSKNERYFPARIVCFDRVTSRNFESYPILALVALTDHETCYAFNKFGKGSIDNIQLHMAPVKREEWVNIYKNDSHYALGREKFSSEALAEQYSCDPDYVKSVLVKEWEE